MRRRNKRKRWLVYTRGLLDKLFSFIITARTTYTAATRHLSADVQCFDLRRQDVVKLGTAMPRAFVITPETGRCTLCGPDPEFIIIDGQAIGCTDPDDAQPVRVEVECPVLDIPATKLCVVEDPGLRAALTKVLRSSAALTETQIKLLRKWHDDMMTHERPTTGGSAAYIFFTFFPLGSDAPRRDAAPDAVVPDGSDRHDPHPSAGAAQSARSRKRTAEGSKRTLEASLKLGANGELTLGGSGPPAIQKCETWRDRTGICAPNFRQYHRDDDGTWLAAMPFLQAMLAETVSGMFQAHDEDAVRLAANTLRLLPAGAWREVTDALDGVGFVSSFIGQLAPVIDADARFRVALGQLLRAAVDVENSIDKAFDKAARSPETQARGARNADYCDKWGATPTPSDFREWLATQAGIDAAALDDPTVCFEYFADLRRVRPGVKDSEAAKRRVGYRGKDRHAADMEGELDACMKAFSIKCGLTQGVFNVVCPHVITLGFRCLFRAESVGEALSVVLERFPKLPKVIFYDVACKLDKNALRRVRPILRTHGVRCILDRPHSITHSCSPVYMPDESLGSTAGVATQAAEVSHSIAVANRTSLAYMSPVTYMVHKMAQVAMMNVRKLHRLSQDSITAENDHVPLAPFYHSHLSRDCVRGSSCICQTTAAPPRTIDGVISARLGAVSLYPRGSSERLGPGEVVAGADPSVSAGRLVGHAGPVVNEEQHNQYVDRDTHAGTLVEPGVSPLDKTPASTGRGPSFDPLSTSLLTVPEADFVLSFTDGREASSAVRPSNKASAVLLVSDFLLLCSGRWLNDEIMNSFVALINDRDVKARCARSAIPSLTERVSLPPDAPVLPRTHMFNTYFFSRMVERNRPYDYAGVQNWGRKFNLHMDDVDIIIVPINVDSNHWIAVIINIRDRSFVFYDPLMGSGQERFISHLRRWVTDEVGQHLGQEAALDWGVEQWPVSDGRDLPKQMDAVSCGVLAVADCFAVGAAAAFSHFDIHVLRNRVAIALFHDDLTMTGTCDSPRSTVRDQYDVRVSPIAPLPDP